MNRVSLLGLALALTIPAAQLQAAALGYKDQFSAEQVHVGADGQRTAIQKMYVGESAVRFEGRQGPGMVDIADLAGKKGYRLMPAQNAYLEMPLPPQMQAEAAKGGSDKPCAGLQGVSCSKQGEEEINGRTAEKWEFVGSNPKSGEQVKSVQWIDKERKLPVKYDLPNGASFEARMLGEEELNGRKVEKWENTTKQKGRIEVTTYWFDPSLNVRVREEFPGGVGRELTDIQVGPQPVELFQVPAGYRKIDPQQMMQQQGMPPQGGHMPQQQGRYPQQQGQQGQGYYPQQRY